MVFLKAKKRGKKMGYLAIDVGGTKTEIGYAEEFESISFISQKRYESKKFQSLELIIKDFLDLYKVTVDAIGIGIAGPVVEGVCHTTNLPWIVDQHKIANEFTLKKCVMVNDLVANFYGIEAVKKEDQIVLQKGIQALKGNKALISVGTGLGEAGMYYDGKKYHPFPTEGGHCDFAPTDQEEIELLKFIQKKFVHVSYERILSGKGFYTLYQFYTEVMNLPKEDQVEQTEESKKPGVITELALQQKSKTCQKVLERFVKVLANEAANLSLKMYALGGVYIGGGVAPKIIPALKTTLFPLAFKDKGRFHDWLNFITITLINDEKTALKGAALVLKYN